MKISKFSSLAACWGSLCISLLTTGCDEKFPVYSSFCDSSKSTFNVPCLHYVGLDKRDQNLLATSLGYPDNLSCNYRLELTKYKVKTCNNPVVKSIGGDFNGYVRLEIKKGFKCYYKIQSDYQYDVNAAFERVIEKAKNEIKKSIGYN